MPRLVRPYRPTLTAELRHRVHAQLRCGEREILVDVGRLSDIDAAGVGQLVRVYNVTKAAKAEFRLANATARVRGVLQLVGLFDVMNADQCAPDATLNSREPQASMPPSRTV